MERWIVTLRRTVEATVSVRAATEEQARRAAEGYWPDIGDLWTALPDNAEIVRVTQEGNR